MQRILSTYSPISLDEMQGIKLMNRIDTKFVTTTGVLSQLLLMANGAYRVQEIGGERNMRYNTTYLDTPDYQMFYAHQWGHANRQKVRFRTYVSSDIQFLEVKTKNNHGRTKKTRMEVGDMNLCDDLKRDFLGRHLCYDASGLLPVTVTSAPASRYAVWMVRITSGRARQRFSNEMLTKKFRRYISVPIAPSKITMRSCRAF